MIHFRFIVWHVRNLIIIAMMLFISACGVSETPTPTLAPPPTEVPLPTPLPNTPPEIQALAGSPREICPGDSTELVALVVDTDGDSLTYFWTSETGTISNQSEDTNGGRANYQGSAQPGEDSIELTVSDGKGGTHEKQTSIIVRGDCVPSIGINSPKDSLNCSEDACQFEVKGSTSSVVSRSDFKDLRLYVLVYPINPPGAGWYIQLQPGSVQISDGLWSQSPSWLGSAEAPVKDGDTIKLLAIIVSTDTNAKTVQGKILAIDQMTGKNNDNVVKDPKDIDATIFIVSDEVNLTVQK